MNTDRFTLSLLKYYYQSSLFDIANFLRRRLQAGGKEKLKQFDIVYTASLYKDLYTQIASKSV